ncbi:hypothetical protein IJH46_01810 [Candidatus Saccharibacteria bacterium]|nr:hypothetical protein [Candidatus Saccharibacteria bacterium]
MKSQVFFLSSSKKNARYIFRFKELCSSFEYWEYKAPDEDYYFLFKLEFIKPFSARILQRFSLTLSEERFCDILKKVDVIDNRKLF